jgi:hypothetical protein
MAFCTSHTLEVHMILDFSRFKDAGNVSVYHGPHVQQNGTPFEQSLSRS